MEQQQQQNGQGTDVMGVVLKWASPILIGVIGYLMIGYLDGIKDSVEELKADFKGIQKEQQDGKVQEYKNQLRLEQNEKAIS